MTASLSRPPTSPAFLTSSMCAGVLLSLGCAASTSPSPAKDPAPASDPTVAAAPVCPSEGTWEVVSTDTSFHKLWRDDGGTVWGLGTHNGARGLYRLEGETWSVALDMSDRSMQREMDPTILFGSGDRLVMATRSVASNVYERVVPPEIPKVAEDRCDHGLWLRDDDRWRPAGVMSIPATGPNARVASFAIMYPFNPRGGPDSAPPVADETALATHLYEMETILEARNEETRLQREEEAMYAEESGEEEPYVDPMERFAIGDGEERDPMEELLDLPPFEAVGGGMFEQRQGTWRGQWSDTFEAALFAAQPGDMVGPSREGDRVVVARVEHTENRRLRPGTCADLWWYDGWQAPSGVTYIGGSVAGKDTYPLGHVARIEGDEIRFMPDSCGITPLGSPGDSFRWYGSGRLCAPIFDVWGATESDIFAVGDSGHMIHYDGSGWTPLKTKGWTVPTNDLNAVWGVTGGGGVFAVGSEGSIVQGRHKGDLALVPTPTEARLLEVWGRSASDVFAVGEGGTILHFDGDAWTQEPSGTDLELNAVVGLDGCDALAASERGVLLRRRSGSNGEATTTATMVAPDRAKSVESTADARTR